MLTMIKGNLFNSKNSLGHCVSLDFTMGQGIAKEFSRMWGSQIRTAAAYSVNLKYPGCLAVDIGDRWIFNIVTKEKYWYKPGITAFTKAVKEMFEFAAVNKVSIISLPKIGCGLDGLSWPRVQTILEDFSMEYAVEVEVYYL